MPNNNEGRNFIDIEDELNSALSRIGEAREEKEKIDDKISAITVQELLEQLKIDEFEKLYVTATTQSNSSNKDEISDEKTEDIQTLAEYELSKRQKDEEISVEEQNKLKAASNFYLIPHTANQRYSVGAEQQVKTVNIYTVNDVEGYSLYTIVDNQNVSMNKSFSEKIAKYINEKYSKEVEQGKINVNEVIENFTPNNVNELYNMLGNENVISTRFLPFRIDEFVQSKGIEVKDIKERETQANSYNNSTIEKNTSMENAEVEPNSLNSQTMEDSNKGNVERNPDVPESIIEIIARLNRVKPAVVNTRVVENFEKVEEDTGIKLKGRYQRGDVIAVRIPYKLGYRTFLVERRTGMTIDGKGRMDHKAGKLYDFDEIEEYFRFKLRNGQDGGENGKALRYDEARDYTTYIDASGEIKKEKYINNGKQQDMSREERQRYLTEVGEADRRLKDAIDEYQKHATHENYQKVKAIIQEKVNIDRKYNALEEQQKITQKTKENTEHVIQRNLDDDDDFYPGSRGFHHY